MNTYWPLTPEEDRRVRAEVIDPLVERSKTNFNELLTGLPGRENVTGREQLAFYRSTDEAYWAGLMGSYPQLAAASLRDWARLSHLYGEPVALT